MSVGLKMAENKGQQSGGASWAALALLVLLVGTSISLKAQSSANQSSNQSSDQPQGQTKPAQSDLPDAPTVQPAPANTAPVPPPRPAEETKPAPVARDPWTNQPIPPPSTGTATQPADETSAPPSMPPVRTVPPGSAKKPSAQEQIYTYVVHTNFVQVPVTVKDNQGRTVDGLLSTDFSVKEKPANTKGDGVLQKLTFFTADPFALSVAVVLDLGPVNHCSD